MLGYAPSPGAKRVLQAGDLARIASRYNLPDATLEPVCFEWAMQTISSADALRSMHQAFAQTEVRIELVHLAKSAAPAGTLVFPKQGLAASSSSSPSTPLLWRGYVLYGEHAKFDIWAEVKLSAQLPRVIVTRTLAMNEPISADAVTVEIQEDSPLRTGIARTWNEVAGKLSRRKLNPGSLIYSSDLTEPFDVKKGEIVTVKAISGAATISTEALAQSSGRTGDVILLQNPKSSKTFRGRIDGQGSVVVKSPPFPLRSAS